MKYFKDDGKNSIDSSSPIEISLSGALKEIENFPLEEGNFIGFTNDKDETIQFVRFEDGWLIDVPVLENGEYTHSVQDGDLTTDKVEVIIRKFIAGEDFKSLCNLSKVG